MKKRHYTVELEDGTLIPFVDAKGGREAVHKVEERTGRKATRYSVPGLTNTWIRTPCAT